MLCRTLRGVYKIHDTLKYYVLLRIINIWEPPVKHRDFHDDTEESYDFPTRFTDRSTRRDRRLMDRLGKHVK